jgi:hypothetical protein
MKNKGLLLIAIFMELSISLCAAVKLDCLFRYYKPVTNQILKIRHAVKIGKAILPYKEVMKELFSDGFVFCKPTDIVSDDFCFFTHNNGKQIIMAFDSRVQGLPGDFMSMIGNTFQINEIREGRGITILAEFLSEIRFQLTKSINQRCNHSDSKDVMAKALVCFDDESKTLEFAGANRPLLLICNGVYIAFKSDKRPIVYYRGEGLSFTNHVIDYQKGDTFFIFTHSYADQFGGNVGKKLKYKLFQEILLSLQSLSMS